MKIIIYEIVHLDWVVPLAELLENSEHEVTFVVADFMQNDIEQAVAGKKKFKWHFINSEQNARSLNRFLSDLCRENAYDIFWLNTANSKHFVFAYLARKFRPMKLIVNVHEVNNLFASRFSFSIKRLARHIGKRLLIKETNAFIVNAIRMKRYIEEQHFTQKPCFYIPPVYYKAPEKMGEKDIFSVVIPGAVSQTRRDYQTAFEAWKLFYKTVNGQANLVLAGELLNDVASFLFSDNEILQSNVQYFECEIPEIVFQKIAANATVILSPQTIHVTRTDDIEETYGITKNSGNSYDVIRNAKPFIVPENLVIPVELDSHTLRYKNARELAAILRQLHDDPTLLDRLNRQALQTSLLFTKELSASRISEMLKSLK